MAYELPSLQKKIDEFNELFELDGNWNVRYVVEEDDYDNSVLVHLYDYSETLDSDEFYGIGAYGELFPRWFERFEKAVQEDTGDAEFYFEPYSYSGHFIGRAHLKGQKRWSSMKKARLINGYPWEGPGQYTIVDAVHGETVSEWFDDEMEFEEFVGDFDDDDPYSEWEVYYDGVSAYASKSAMRNRKFSMRKKASDGWDKDICYDLISVLNRCYELSYDVENCVRGAYCRQAGDTYESLGQYAQRLGRDLEMAGEELVDMYGDMTWEEIEDM